MISIIVAMANDRVIGKDNDFPWYISADLVRFKNLTVGNTVIMGRKTYDPHLLTRIGKPLPDRQNIIITRDNDYRSEDVVVTHSINEALSKASGEEVFFIGGEQIYRLALPFAERIYITQVHAQIEGDAFFPVIDTKLFKEVGRSDHKKDTKNQYDYSFLTLEKVI